MTCSMLSAIIAPAAQKKYLRNTGWRSAANDWGEAAVTLGYYKSREGRRRRRVHRGRRAEGDRDGPRLARYASPLGRTSAGAQGPLPLRALHAARVRRRAEARHSVRPAA